MCCPTTARAPAPATPAPAIDRNQIGAALEPLREVMLALGQEQVNRRWAEYEEMATRGAERFAPDQK